MQSTSGYQHLLLIKFPVNFIEKAKALHVHVVYFSLGFIPSQIPIHCKKVRNPPFSEKT